MNRHALFFCFYHELHKLHEFFKRGKLADYKFVQFVQFVVKSYWGYYDTPSFFPLRRNIYSSVEEKFLLCAGVFTFIPLSQFFTYSDQGMPRFYLPCFYRSGKM